jgi:hypothetical protein
MAFARITKTGLIILTEKERKRLKKEGIDVTTTCKDQRSVSSMAKEVKKKYKKGEASSEASLSGSDSDSDNSLSSVSFSSDGDELDVSDDDD